MKLIKKPMLGSFLRGEDRDKSRIHSASKPGFRGLQIPRAMKNSYRWAALLFFAASGSARAETSDQELAKQLQNPVASLISVPFQSNWDFGIGPSNEGWRYTMNFQPVIPISLNKDWNVIVRTIVPFTHQEDVFKGSVPGFSEVVNAIPIDLTGRQLQKLKGVFNKAVAARTPGDIQTGLGDITQSIFFSPKAPGPGGIIWGIGPAFLYPSATDSLLGSEKWAAGPTVVALKQDGGWTYGVLANQLWSFAGNDGRRSVSALFLQPFISYTTETKTTLSLNTESTYDWMAGQYTAPLNASISQVLKIGKLPLSLALGGRYYVEGPSGAPEWGLRFVVTLLFPEGKHASASGGKEYAK